MINIPQVLADLLNKTDSGFVVVAHMVPTRVFRITRSENACTFRVEQFKRTNKDNMNPQGTWATLSTHGSETPWGMYATAQTAAVTTQAKFIKKMQERMQAATAEVQRGFAR